MNAADLARMQTVFDAALERPPAERDAFLDEACGGDADLRARVARLLDAGDESSGGGIVRDAVRRAAISLTATGDHTGRTIGAWRLLRELGHGGMGTVWLAERADAAYRAQVAIKLVRGGFATRELSERFRAERQILADLHHPNIATLLGGGETQDGSPYLAMEYVDGRPITAFAREEGLRLRDRLRLFRLVCDAVRHAHRSLVVHRDIKPSNVLVAADGIPKLLDFGIAKLLTPDGSAETTVQARRLTPSYASPEQLRGDRITVATDVYSLGVLLFELLTDEHPFAADGAASEEVRRRVLEREPPRPSEALRRRSRSGSISVREVAGDLDNIVAKAMRKEPEYRYGSVEALADDIDRMLAGEPVLARRASLRYRARKFVARHMAAVAGVVLLFLSLVAGLSATMWQARRAERERTAAQLALGQATAVKDFLTSLFRASDPNESRGAEVTARELLARGLSRVDDLDGQPALQADLLETLARVQMSLGEYRQAKDMFEREIAIRRAVPALARDSMVLSALNGRGQALDQLGVPDSAAAAFQEAITFGSANVGETHSIVIAAENNLGNALYRLGRDSEAEQQYLKVIELQRRVLGPDHPDRATVLNNLGLQYANQGRYAEAEPLLREAVRVRMLDDSAGVNTSFVIDNLGMMLREAGRYDEAEPFARRGLRNRLTNLGPRHRYTGESYSSLGKLLAIRGRPADFAEADSMLHAALEVYVETLGAKHRAVAYVQHALGVLALQRGDPGAAENWFRQALAIRRGSGDNPRERVRTLVRLAEAERARRESGARASIDEADSLARATLTPKDPVRIRAAIGLAIARTATGDTAAAERQYRQAIAALAGSIGAAHPYVTRACAAGGTVGLRDSVICRLGG